MTSKRYKKLPEKTKELQAELIEKLIPVIKNNWRRLQRKK